MKLVAAFVAAYLILAGGFCLLANIAGAQEILPMNAPEIHTKAIKILTAEERSEIIISDIWKQPELERIKIGAGGRLGMAKSDTPRGPYGWHAYVGQDAQSSWRGGFEAFVYGGL